jgi:peptide/nickel transport system ATP-binding protein
MEACSVKKPAWQEVDKNHFVACHLYDRSIMGDPDFWQIAATK